ncbi:flagellar brake protein [Acidithiobacillus caldus]
MSESFAEARHRLFEERYALSSQVKAMHVLEELRRSHAFCTLWFDGRAQSFSSILLERQDDTLTVDLPVGFDGRVAPGVEVTLLARLEGVITGCRTILREVKDDGLVLSTPEQVYQLQRRQLYRVPPAVDDPTDVQIQRDGARPLAAIMQDISAGGLRILAPKPEDYPFQAGEHVPRLLFRLRDSDELSAAAVVRFAEQQTGHNGGIVLGLELQELSPTIRETIARYVQTRDREILKSLGLGMQSLAPARPESWSSRVRRWWRG